MYCGNCGQKLPDDAIFCSNCGAQVQSPRPQPTPQPPRPETRWEERPDSYTDNDPGYAGPAQGPDSSDEITVNVSDVEKYITLAAGAIGFLPLLLVAMGLLLMILSGINRILGYIPPFWLLMEAIWNIKRIVAWVVIILAVVTVAGLIFLAVRRRGEKIMVFVGIADAVLVFVAALMGRRGTLGFGLILFAILALIPALSLFMNVFIHHLALYGSFHPDQDLAGVKEMLASSRTAPESEPEPVYPGGDSDYTIPIDDVVPTQYTGGEPGGESYFDGTGLDLFVKQIILAIVTMLTCSLATPWALVQILKWRMEHTVIEGKRQKFNGTAMQLFGLWIKWVLLSIITCGIYALFAYVDYTKWVVKHTSYDFIPEHPTGVYPDSYFDGSVAEYIGLSIISSLLTMVTCGIGAPWGITMLTSWQEKGTVVGGDRYYYTGTGGGLLGTYIVSILLSLITCGIYGSWATCRINRYVVRNIHVSGRAA